MTTDNAIRDNLPFLFAPVEKTGLNTENTENREEYKKISWAKLRKMARVLAICAFLPVCAGLGIGLYRQTMTLVDQVSSLEDVEYGGDYDPTGGEEIHTENDRALIVVHEGFGIESNEDKFSNNPEYMEYLRRLQATKVLYIENGDPIVIVVTDYSLSRGNVDLTPHDNVMYLVTSSNNGISVPAFIYNNVSYNQHQQDVWDILKRAGINQVEISGEFRGACPSQVARYAKGSGLEVGWCADCSYPVIDETTDPDQYPTLVPLP